MSCGIQEAIVFGMGMLTGTGTTLTGKVMYQIDAIGIDGSTKKFEKPIFQTWGMFLAMIFALPIHYLYTWYVHRAYHAKNGYEKVGASLPPPAVPLRTYFLLAVPAAFDLIATFLANVGLMYVTVSVFQLMKCTVIIFVAILKAFVLKDRVSSYMWVGIGINTVAVFLVGMTSFGDADEQVNNVTNNPAVGILMIVLSCLVQSGQYVFEERIMDESCQPLVVVGMEGLWGFMFTTFIVYPIAYFVPGNDLGSYERFDDAWTMLQGNTGAQVVALLYVFVILGYNVFAVLVTYLLNSIWHAILDNFRPISVWGTDLLIFYVFTNGNFGEAWTAWSWLQLGGMLLLLCGTAIYNASIRIPGMDYSEHDMDSTATPVALISKSPLLTKNLSKMVHEARNTPKQSDKERIRREYITEYHPTDGASKPTTYGSFEA